MTRILWILLALLPLTAHPDDTRVMLVERQVNDLQRQVDSLARQVGLLAARPDRGAIAASAPPAAAATAASPAESAAAPQASAVWIDASRWRKLKPGTPELDVVRLLGPPTSMREQQGARVLFYALEIGTSGFLGGSVTIRDHAVAEVRTPTLQ